MEIVQVNSSDKKLVRRFVRLPFDLYKNVPEWVPPFLHEERFRFNIHKNPFYEHSQAAFFLAIMGDQTIGRIAVINNQLFNKHNHATCAIFNLFECKNDPEVASRLFQAAIDWARSKGLTRIIGPKGFTPLDGFGLLVKGFEHRPALGIPYNPPYYADLIEGLGFTVESDTLSGFMDANSKFPGRIHELSLRVQQRRDLSVAHFKKRQDIKSLIPQIKDLYNGVLQGTAGGYPLSEADAKAMASQILWFADPTLIKIVIKKDEEYPCNHKMVGFLLAYPDISNALLKIGGRIFPFGWISILRELKKTDRLNINGAGLIEEFRGSGGTAILFSEMQKSIVESGQFRQAEIVQIGLDNRKMLREMENFGISFNKLHRVYQMELDLFH